MMMILLFLEENVGHFSKSPGQLESEDGEGVTTRGGKRSPLRTQKLMSGTTAKPLDREAEKDKGRDERKTKWDVRKTKEDERKTKKYERKIKRERERWEKDKERDESKTKRDESKTKKD